MSCLSHAITVPGRFPKEKMHKEDEDVIKIAVVGKPNAGKSSLINRLTGENRVIVSSIAGTTRDAINVPFKCNGKKYSLIDTAGMRKKNKIDDKTIERYSIIRSLDAVREADVVLIMIDANEGITDQDQKIAQFVCEENKPSVVVINKWDLIEKNTHTMKEFERNLQVQFPFMSFYESVYLSVLTGQKIDKLMKSVEKVYENSRKKISSGDLNEAIQNAYFLNSPTYKDNKKLRIFYATQSSECPPTFVLFVNDTKLITDNYLKYLENSLRKAFDFTGTPIKITLKSKKEEDL